MKIIQIDDEMNVQDITSWSREGRIYGNCTSLGNIGIYYDSAAEFEVPTDIALVGNYPNPFNPSTTIYYYVKRNDSDIKISVLDLLGREVKILYEGNLEMGYYEVNWDGTNHHGMSLGSGMYFIEATINSERVYRKMMKLK